MKLKDFHRVIETVCERHQTQLWQSIEKVRAIDVKDPYHVTLCPICTQEKIDRDALQENQLALTEAELAKTYNVLEKKSIIPPKLSSATYSTFTVANKTDEQARGFGLYLNERYLKHGDKGNAILQGAPGVGKSHLTLAIARKLNEDFKAIGQPKAILFMPVNRLFQTVQAGFDKKDGISRYEMMNLLTGVDFLFLDDLGKESTFGSRGNEASNWKQEFLYELLDMRERTILNTNLTGKQLKQVYDPALVSRIMDGVGKNVFVYPENAEDRRKLPF